MLEKLHHLLINEPLAGLDLAKDIFYCALLLILKAPTFEKFDLQIIPLVINLPVTTNITDLLQRPTNRIESFQGVLTSKTTMAKYVYDKENAFLVKFILIQNVITCFYPLAGEVQFFSVKILLAIKIIGRDIP